MSLTQPSAPRLLSWAVAGKLVRGAVLAFMLVWLAGMVAWPESHFRWRYLAPGTAGLLYPLVGGASGGVCVVPWDGGAAAPSDRNVTRDAGSSAASGLRRKRQV